MPADLLFLIGPNGSGKSSALQALALIQYFSQGKTEQFFTDRGWLKEIGRSRLKPDLASQSSMPWLRGLRGISLELFLLQGSTKIYWSFSWGLGTGQLVAEHVAVQESDNAVPNLILSYRRRSISGRNPLPAGENHELDVEINRMKFAGSVLANVEPKSINTKYFEILSKLISWGGGVTSLELLSPSAMRRGDRGSPGNIGSKGERLAGFLASLSPQAKNRVVQRISLFYELEGIDTSRKRAGWIDVKIRENYGNVGALSTEQMSDGFLRILAICAIPEFSDTTSLVLLDEIENGLEPHILPKVLRQINKEAKCQIIVTSHSPILVNFFEPEQVVILSRLESGQTISAPLNELRAFSQTQNFIGTGEIWSNMSMSALLKQVAAAYQRRPVLSATQDFIGHIAEFMREA